MRFRSKRMRLSGLSAAGGMERNASPLARVLSYLVTAVALVLALAFSAVIFGLLLFAGILVGAWFWWKTRALRRQMQEAAEAMAATGTAHAEGEGEIIEGVGVRIHEDRFGLAEYAEPGESGESGKPEAPDRPAGHGSGY
ncbi:conserved exported protein of unknown function [Sterolibacterium denitrificans]|uniref:Uncharacterized protein n=2 Tax=Sterolibacterium denitrificans TaxID=157592 RepID=A0A7Z7MWL1_9PROT|nr:conserved exported protein of unknown function [Sterolibacterium denitrificans]